MLLAFCITFTQCKPIDETNTEIRYVGVSSINNSKTDVSPEGIVTWSSNDFICGYGLDSDMFAKLVQIPISSITDEGKVAHFDYTYQNSGPIGQGGVPLCKDLYHIKDITNYNYQLDGQNYSMTTIAANIMDQTGKKEDVGNYLVAHSKVTFENVSETTSLPKLYFECNFKPLSSVARVNLEGAKQVLVNYSGLNNVFYVERSTPPNCTNKYEECDMLGGGEIYPQEERGITITSPSADTYITLLPQETPVETVVEFTDPSTGEVLGSVTFPNGVKSGKLYAGPNFQPIELKPGNRSTVVETEL